LSFASISAWEISGSLVHCAAIHESPQISSASRPQVAVADLEPRLTGSENECALKFARALPLIAIRASVAEACASASPHLFSTDL